MMHTAESDLTVSASAGVMSVVIDREASRNALSKRVLDALHRVFETHATTADLRYAVLTGAGDRSFAAGGDLKELADVKGAEAGEAMARNAKTALAAIRNFPVPVIGAINGDALGGGAELAMACDMRVIANHARIGFIQGRLAISSAWGGGPDLIRAIGPARALQMQARAELVGADRAREWGLVNEAAGPDQTLDEALSAFTEPMAKQAPHVMRAFKAMAIQDRTRARTGLDEIETNWFAKTWAHPDHDAAVDRMLAKRSGG